MAGFLDDMTPQQYGLLAAGLGILGNSRGQSFGQAVGIGGLQGLDAMAQMQQMRQMQQLRDAQEQRYRAMAEREQRKLDQEDATRAAYKGLDMSGSDEDLISKLSAIDPELALKWRMGQANSPKQFLPSSDGYMVGDLRKGTVTPVMVGGKTVVPAQYDPTTQGNITRNKELNQFTTIEGPTGAKQSGFVKDLSGVSTQALTPEEQDAVINKLNQQPNALSRDEYEAMTSPKVITGLTPGQETAQKERAKADSDRAKKQDSAGRMLKLLTSPVQGKTIETLIDDSTGSGLGALRDSVAGGVGVSTDGASALASLKTLQGWLTAEVPRMEGPQSDADRALYIEMAGNLANPFTPSKQKKESYRTLVEIMTRQSKIQGGESSGGWKNDMAEYSEIDQLKQQGNIEAAAELEKMKRRDEMRKKYIGGGK